MFFLLEGYLFSHSTKRQFSSKMILRHLKHQPGISINGNNINSIKYADDTALIANSPENLLSLFNTVVARSAEYSLTASTAKTKCMVISKSRDKRCNLTMENNKIEQVQHFNYLGSVLFQYFNYLRFKFSISTI